MNYYESVVITNIRYHSTIQRPLIAQIILYYNRGRVTPRHQWCTLFFSSIYYSYRFWDQPFIVNMGVLNNFQSSVIFVPLSEKCYVHSKSSFRLGTKFVQLQITNVLAIKFPQHLYFFGPLPKKSNACFRLPNKMPTKSHHWFWSHKYHLQNLREYN